VARTPPPLYRLTRLFRRLGYVAIAILIVFVATAVYSATEVRPQFGNGFGQASASGTNSTVEFSQDINITNPGFYPLSAVSVSVQARDFDGTLLAHGGSPTLVVGPGASIAIPLTVWVPLSTRASILVTHDAQLPVEVWANATYATLFSFRLADLSNISWGAPFFAFNATASWATPQSNGTLEVDVSVAFQDHAAFADVGTLAFQVLTASGTSCASGSVAVQVLAGNSYNAPLAFWVPASCDPSGGEITSSYSGSGLTVALPPERIP
jgi:hypothetical protein